MGKKKKVSKNKNKKKKNNFKQFKNNFQSIYDNLKIVNKKNDELELDNSSWLKEINDSNPFLSIKNYFNKEKESSSKFNRCVIAKKQISCGTKVLLEKPISAYTHDIAQNREFGDYGFYNCKYCYKAYDISKKTYLTCSNCSYKWCNPKCKDKDQVHHEILCSILNDINNDDYFDHELLSLALQLFIKVNIKEEEEVDKDLNDDSIQAKYQDIFHLAYHDQSLDNANDHMYQHYIDLIQEKIQLKYDSIVYLKQIVNIINANVHNLSLIQTDFGMGLYPYASLFNHSCYPNCVFINTNNCLLSCVTLRDINKGEELYVNYIDLYDISAIRQKILKQEKSFLCQCNRCLLQPINEDELIKFKNEAKVHGILCTKKMKCTGYYEKVIKEQLAEKEKEEEEEEGKEIDSFYQCNKCYKTVQNDEITTLEQLYLNEVNQALSIYNNPTSTLQISATKIITCYNLLKSKLHHEHAILFKLYPALINIYGAIGEFGKKIDLCRSFLNMSLHNCYPKQFPSLRMIYNSYASSLAQKINILAQNRSTKGLLGKNKDKLIISYMQERKQLLTSYMNILKQYYPETNYERILISKSL